MGAWWGWGRAQQGVRLGLPVLPGAGGPWQMEPVSLSARPVGDDGGPELGTRSPKEGGPSPHSPLAQPRGRNPRAGAL